ncbi:protein-L-isoaspartate O-methyltransferase [Amycolatopsis magusensis]|uniref:protein-L-isoaspartate O-methyltransferase n=1 Tax=Amycolatopsis magusensis TaxID=882444 RepID=UPI00379CD53C
MPTTAPPSFVDDHCGRERRALRTALADGDIDPAVANAFAAEPRDCYTGAYTIPRRTTPLRRDPENNPAQWLRDLYSPDTALELIHGRGPTAPVAAPSLTTMATVLTLAGIHPGHAVLEIGTGSGYTAALIRHLTATGPVRSLEPHPDWHTHAAAALAGRAETVHTTDLTLSHDDGPCVDRIIAWREPDHIPRGWLDRLTPGGRIVTVYGGAITVLTVDEHGHGHATFHQPAVVTALDAAPRLHPHPTWNELAMLPEQVRPDHPGLRLMLRCLLPGVQWTLDRAPGRGSHVILTDPATQSNAIISCSDPHAHHEQSGPLQLWTRMQRITEHWHTSGRPQPAVFTATFDPARPTVTLTLHRDGQPVDLPEPAPHIDQHRSPGT